MNKEYLKEFNIKLEQVRQERAEIEKETRQKERIEKGLPVINMRD